MIANQERIFGKLALMDATKVMFASPPKRFSTSNASLKPKKISFAATPAKPKEIEMPMLSNEPLPIAATIESDLDIFGVEGISTTTDSQFSYAQLQKFSFQSTSIPNFAKKLSAEIFSETDRIGSNCSGTKGKRQLDPTKLEKIKQYVFQMYSMSASEEETMWKKCKDAINEAGRRKK